MTESENNSRLWRLLEKGGVYYNVPGNSVQEVLNSLMGLVPLPETVTAQNLLRAVMEREALMPTGIGDGIAIPHPRNPVTDKNGEQFAALAFLKEGIDWKALDSKPVDTLLLLVSASAKLHLRTLSVISYFCGCDDFNRLLKERASRDALIRFIKDTEKQWE